MIRVLFWVQHLLGTGHTVRAAAIARAAAERGARVTLALGAAPPATLDLTGLDVVALPPVRATDETFNTIVGDDGLPYVALAPARRALLVDLAERIRPDVLLLETYPLGRRAFAPEVLPLIEAARRGGAVIAASVRDVLVRKTPAREAEMAEAARNLLDLLLVHADPAFVRLEESFPAAATLSGRIRYTGFVHAPAPPPAPPSGEVVVSAGGSTVGVRLTELALGAAERLPEQRFRILVAAGLGNRLLRWQAAAPRNVVIEPVRPDFRSLLSAAALSVSQAGYNTALDVLAAGCRAILVPFAAGGETEQTDRAEALARRGLATHLAEATLTEDGLAGAIRTALAAPPPARPMIDLSGAGRTADMLVAAGRRMPIR
jgi:predicted glycosyltransferase